ncbi:MAG: M20/M25/M40 family metallo-hydrolase [Kiloniellales bacterium]|nr:M20/M25/M40 family metallo-hydrolase [Kiloniellales bacterium]
MTREEVLAHVDEQACLDFLASMVRHKSYTETEGERQLAAYMRDRMAALGLEAELQPVVGERVNAIGRLKGSGGGSSLLFNGHLDTNPVTEGWTVDPWGGVVDDDFIYGIGVSNMKAGDAAYFCAVETLLKAGLKPKGDVILTYVVGELQGGVGTVRAIEQGVRADYFINSEPTDIQALTLHAGAFNFVIELEGITRHISKREEAVDAIAAACALVPQINAMTFSGAANDKHLSVNRANVGVLRGALSREFHDWRPPQIADFVRLTGTARYAPSQSKESVLADFRALLDRLEADTPGLRATVRAGDAEKGHPSMLPFEVADDACIVRTVNAAYREIRGADQPTGALRPPAFYGTDAAHFLHRAGMEGIVCGPGGKYNTMPDERVDRADYLDAVRLYLLAIIDICGVA